MDGPDRRERIVQAAAALFEARQDVHGVSVDEVAARAGVAKATLYRYFPSKAAIVEAIRQTRGNASVAGWQAPDRRTKIIDAAIRLIVRQGVRATTVEQLAEAAGISAPAIYWHFASKDDLIVAVADRCSPLPQVRETLARGADGDLREDLRALGRLMLHVLADRFTVVQQIMVEMGSNPRVAGHVLQHVALPVWMTVGQYLEAHVQAGRLRPAPLLPRVFTLAGPVFAYSLGRRAMGPAFPLAPEQAVDTLIDTFLTGAATPQYRKELTA